ncbi:MAG: hypothetical protein WCQ99_12615, partial [Pseudomonadota bacterium]
GRYELTRKQQEIILNDLQAGGLSQAAKIIFRYAEAGRAVHPAITEALLEHPEALPLHDCAECGADIPIISGREIYKNGTHQVYPARTLFKKCPSCGGATGCNAFFLKHGYVFEEKGLMRGL